MAAGAFTGVKIRNTPAWGDERGKNMVRMKNPHTNETRTFRFRWWITGPPFYAAHLLFQGAFITGLLSIVPLFAIILMFFYTPIMRRLYRRKGWVEVNDFGQEVGPAVQPAQIAQAG